jgi:hypothetical protein
MTTFEWCIVAAIGLYVLYRFVMFVVRVVWVIDDERRAQERAESIAKTLGVPVETVRRPKFKVKKT